LRIEQEVEEAKENLPQRHRVTERRARKKRREILHPLRGFRITRGPSCGWAGLDCTY
jgi:hypothetical protein